MSSLPTGTNPHPNRHLQYPTTPWRPSDALARRIQGTPETDGYKKCLVRPSDPEFSFVWDAFYQQKPTEYGIKKIHIIYHEKRRINFENTLSNIETKSNNPYFAPKWRSESEAATRENLPEMEAANRSLYAFGTGRDKWQNRSI